MKTALTTAAAGSTLRQRPTVMLAGLGALIMASSVFVLGAPTATAAGTDKVFVCKFITTPGEGEILQTGTNPISVSVSAIVGADPNTDGASLVGASFSDGQERSLVIAVDDTPPGPAGDPDVSACQPPATEVAIALQPATTDPCGPGNIAFVVPADTGQLDFSLLADGNVTVAPKAGFQFAGDSQLVTFTLPADSNEICTSTVEIPAQPKTSDPCGPGNIAFVVPADTDQLDFTLLADGNVTVAPKAGFQFAGASQLVTFTLPTDSGAACAAGQQGGAPDEVLGEEASNNNGNNNSGNNNNGGTNEVLGAQASANNAPAAAQQSAPAAPVPTVINAGTAGEAPANPFGTPAAIALFGALMGLIALGMRGGLARVGGGKA